MDSIDYKLQHVELVDAHVRECVRIARVVLDFALAENVDPVIAVELAQRLAASYWIEFYPGRRRCNGDQPPRADRHS